MTDATATPTPTPVPVPPLPDISPSGGRGLRLVWPCLRDLWALAGWQLVLSSAVLSVLAAMAEGSILLLLAPLVSAGASSPEGLAGTAAIAGGGKAVNGGMLSLAGGLAGLGLSSQQVLAVLLGVWLSCVAAGSGLAAWRDSVSERLFRKTVSRFQHRLYRALTATAWMTFVGEKRSVIQTALTQMAVRVAFGSRALSTLFGRLTLTAMRLGLALSIAPLPAVLALVAAGLLLLLQLPLLRRLLARGRRTAGQMQFFNTLVSEHLGSLKLAKIHHVEAALEEDFAAALHRHHREQGQMAREMSALRVWGKVMVAVLLSLVAWLSLMWLALPLPFLLVLLAALARLLAGLNEMSSQLHQLVESLPSWQEGEALRHRLMQREAPVQESPVQEGQAQENPVQGDLHFRNVSFSWPGREAPAVSGLTLTLPRRKTTALVGPSGAGKSTIADLACGLLVPQDGCIMAGRDVLAGPALAAWQDALACVPQDSFMLHDTVRANLLWLSAGLPADRRPDGDKALWQALEQAAAGPMVRALPAGLDTVIGDGGIRLSGGERQRLALARALLRQPSFLLLDEATSHLDRQNELLFQQSVRQLQGGITILMIAHRLETVRHADRIVVIEQGRIREQGSWDELMALPEGWLAATVGRQDGDSGEDVTSSGIAAHH